jgi:hypothetical protein
MMDIKSGDLLLCIKDYNNSPPFYIFVEIGKTYAFHSVNQNGDFIVINEDGRLILYSSDCFMKMADATAFDILVYGVE